MSRENPSSNTMRSRSETLLHRSFLVAKGRSDGFEFVWDHRSDLSVIETEIREQLELFEDLKTGPLAPGVGPRLYKDAYVTALQEAAKILQEGENF